MQNKNLKLVKLKAVGTCVNFTNLGFNSKNPGFQFVLVLLFWGGWGKGPQNSNYKPVGVQALKMLL